eukprot:3265102-Prymnesium_polylepis.1
MPSHDICPASRRPAEHRLGSVQRPARKVLPPDGVLLDELLQQVAARPDVEVVAHLVCHQRGIGLRGRRVARVEQKPQQVARGITAAG